MKDRGESNLSLEEPGEVCRGQIVLGHEIKVRILVQSKGQQETTEKFLVVCVCEGWGAEGVRSFFSFFLRIYLRERERKRERKQGSRRRHRLC